MTTIGSLFSGIGGFELGLERGISGSRTIWQVEQDAYCQKVLQRHWPTAELFDDVEKVGRHNLSQVDIICGGFPCQGFSVSGNMEGLDHEKSNLWWQMHRIIGELRPSVVVLENVPAIRVQPGMRDILGSLAEIGYDAEWITLSASSRGAPHRRSRWFGVCHPSEITDRRRPSANTHGIGIGAQNEIRPGRATAHAHAPQGLGSYWHQNKAPSPL